MTGYVENIRDRGVGGNEALGLDLRLEALHLALSSPDREVRSLSPGVFAQPTGLLFATVTEDIPRCRVRHQSVSDDPLRQCALVPEQPPQQFERSGHVASLLDEHLLICPLLSGPISILGLAMK